MCKDCGCRGSISLVASSATPPETASSTKPTPSPFSERVSDSLQDAIKGVIASHRKPPRRLKSLLNGTWFGHPLHPVITDMPITAWMLTAVFAILWLISPAHFSWAAHGSHFCLHDGRVLTGPLTVNAPRYDVRMSNGQVEVKRL